MLALLLAQAALPPAGMPYAARTEYAGAGVVCGAAYSLRLAKGETAVLTKRSFAEGTMHFHLREGTVTIRESQYATAGGTVVWRKGAGVLRRKRQGGQFLWIYRDNAPGSTDIRGPAVNSARSAALNRIAFEAPRYGMADGERCLSGRSTGNRGR